MLSFAFHSRGRASPPSCPAFYFVAKPYRPGRNAQETPLLSKIQNNAKRFGGKIYLRENKH